MLSADAPKIVALLGVSGSGKSIVARRLLASGFQRVRFGDAARDMLSGGFGCTPHEIDGDQRNIPQTRFGGMTVQNLMQSLTHDWGRGGVHSDIWANEWRRRVSLLRPPLPGHKILVLSDDLQRPNEAAAVREAGGIVVRITRPGYVPANPGAFHKQARITHDVELINEGPEKLVRVTETFVQGLGEWLASIAA
jgi:hypothetical protein